MRGYDNNIHTYQNDIHCSSGAENLRNVDGCGEPLHSRVLENRRAQRLSYCQDPLVQSGGVEWYTATQIAGASQNGECAGRLAGE